MVIKKYDELKIISNTDNNLNACGRFRLHKVALYVTKKPLSKQCIVKMSIQVLKANAPKSGIKLSL